MLSTHTQPHSVVFINLQTYKESIVITIEDTGPGVLPVNINKLLYLFIDFEKQPSRHLPPLSDRYLQSLKNSEL